LEVTGPEMKLSLFHALGKVLFNKYSDSRPENKISSIVSNQPTHPKNFIHQLFEYKNEFNNSVDVNDLALLTDGISKINTVLDWEHDYSMATSATVSLYHAFSTKNSSGNFNKSRPSKVEKKYNWLLHPALAEKNKPLIAEKQDANVVMSQQECYLLIDSSDDDDDFEDFELSEHDVDMSGLDEIDLDETF